VSIREVLIAPTIPGEPRADAYPRKTDGRNRSFAGFFAQPGNARQQRLARVCGASVRHDACAGLTSRPVRAAKKPGSPKQCRQVEAAGLYSPVELGI
jgi:hypothetical protein